MADVQVTEDDARPPDEAPLSSEEEEASDARVAMEIASSVLPEDDRSPRGLGGRKAFAFEPSDRTFPSENATKEAPVETASRHVAEAFIPSDDGPPPGLAANPKTIVQEIATKEDPVETAPEYVEEAAQESVEQAKALEEAKAAEEAAKHAKALEEAKAAEEAAKQAKALEEAKAAEEAARQAKALEEARAAEEAARQAKAQEEAKAAEEIARQAKALEDAKAAEEVARQAKALEEAKAAEEAAAQTKALEEARAAEEAARQAKALEESKAAEEAAEQAKALEEARAAEETAKQAKALEEARAAEEAARQAKALEEAKAAEEAAREAKALEEAKAAEEAAREAKALEEARAAEETARQAKALEEAKAAEEAARQAKALEEAKAAAEAQAEVAASIAETPQHAGEAAAVHVNAPAETSPAKIVAPITPAPQHVGEDPEAIANSYNKWSVDTSYIDHRTADPNRLEGRRGAADTAEEGVPAAGMPTRSISPRPSAKDEGGNWKQVDVSYINHRTLDPNRLEVRRTTADTAEEGLPGAPTCNSPRPSGSATVKREADGKWNVDTSYIDHRTADPNRLESRRVGGGEQPDEGGTNIDLGPVTSTTTVKKEGKWNVDTSYIDYRTADPNRLEPRRAAGTSELPDDSAQNPELNLPAAPSATVKKEADGKWKVDTSYIGYRTGDTANLIRKDEGNKNNAAFSDPAEKKYSYAEIKGNGIRPPDVDPERKEQYLAEEEFKSLFQMGSEEFAKLPKWKRQNIKKAKDLF